VPLDKRKTRAESETLPTLAVVSLSRIASLVGGYLYLARSRCPPEPAQASSRTAAVEPRYTFSPFGARLRVQSGNGLGNRGMNLDCRRRGLEDSESHGVGQQFLITLSVKEDLLCLMRNPLRPTPKRAAGRATMANRIRELNDDPEQLWQPAVD
jgi:hypothetical protein